LTRPCPSHGKQRTSHAITSCEISLLLPLLLAVGMFASDSTGVHKCETRISLYAAYRLGLIQCEDFTKGDYSVACYVFSYGIVASCEPTTLHWPTFIALHASACDRGVDKNDEEHSENISDD